MPEIQSDKKRLTIVGIYQASEAYPNVKYRLQDLHNTGQFEIEEINYPLWTKQNIGNSKRYGIFRNSYRFIVSHLYVTFRFFIKSKCNYVYIPYPAPTILATLSFLPSFKTRKYIIDAFISLYDTTVIDRKLIKKGNPLAKLLKWVEWRAFSAAHLIITDTQENSAYLSDIFNIENDKFLALPLSTNEIYFKAAEYKPDPSHQVRILFVGTLVPLHGIETILSAYSIASKNIDASLTLIGDGQDGPIVEAVLKRTNLKIKWIKKWQDSIAIADHIKDSDICLGIFGEGEKTQRVCPYKIYYYAACGRAIITGKTEWSNNAIMDTSNPPFLTSKVGCPQSLATLIEDLAKNDELRQKLSINSHRFYLEKLSNIKSIEKLKTIVSNF